jgi:hypothetical protein
MWCRMSKSFGSLSKALNPFRYPWQAAKGGAEVLYHRLEGGGGLGALWTSPWGTYGTLKWILDGPSVPPRPPGLEIGSTQTDRQGFAIYGTVRVSGTSVIPPC